MVRATAGGVTLAVRAQPGAKKTAITGIYGEGAAAQLKIAVHAPRLGRAVAEQGVSAAGRDAGAGRGFACGTACEILTKRHLRRGQSPSA